MGYRKGVRPDIDNFNTGVKNENAVPMGVETTMLKDSNSVDTNTSGSIARFKRVDEELLENMAKAGAQPAEEADVVKGGKEVYQFSEATVGILTMAGTEAQAMAEWDKHVERVNTIGESGYSTNSLYDMGPGGTVSASYTFDNDAASNFIKETGVSLMYTDEDGLDTYTSFQNAYTYRPEMGSGSFFNDVLNNDHVYLYDSERNDYVSVDVNNTFISSDKIPESEGMTLKQYVKKQRADENMGLKPKFSEEDQANFFGLTFKEMIYKTDAQGKNIKQEIYHGATARAKIGSGDLGRMLGLRAGGSRSGKVNISIAGRDKDISVESDDIVKRYAGTGRLTDSEVRDAKLREDTTRISTMTNEAYNYTFNGRMIDVVRKNVRQEKELAAQYFAQELGVGRAKRLTEQLASGRAGEYQITTALKRANVSEKLLKDPRTRQVIESLADVNKTEAILRRADKSRGRTVRAYTDYGRRLVDDSDLVQGARQVKRAAKITHNVVMTGATAAWNASLLTAQGAAYITGSVGDVIGITQDRLARSTLNNINTTLGTARAGVGATAGITGAGAAGVGATGTAGATGAVGAAGSQAAGAGTSAARAAAQAKAAKYTQNAQRATEFAKNARNVSERISEFRTWNKPRDLEKRFIKDAKDTLTLKHQRDNLKSVAFSRLTNLDSARRKFMARTRLGRIALRAEDTVKAAAGIFTKGFNALSAFANKIRWGLIIALACFVCFIIINNIALSVFAVWSTPAGFTNESEFSGTSNVFNTAASEVAMKLYTRSKEFKDNTINSSIAATFDRIRSEAAAYEEKGYVVDYGDFEDSDGNLSTSTSLWGAMNDEDIRVRYLSTVGQTLEDRDLSKKKKINEYVNGAGDDVWTEGLQYYLYNEEKGKWSDPYFKNDTSSLAFEDSADKVDARRLNCPTQFINAKQIMCASDFVLSQEFTRSYTKEESLNLALYIFNKTHSGTYENDVSWTKYYKYERTDQETGETKNYWKTKKPNDTERYTWEKCSPEKIKMKLSTVKLTVNLLMQPSIACVKDNQVKYMYGPILAAQTSPQNVAAAHPIDFNNAETVERYEMTLANEWKSAFQVEGYDVYGYLEDDDGNYLELSESGTPIKHYIETRIGDEADLSSLGDSGGFADASDDFNVAYGDVEGLADTAFSLPSFEHLSLDQVNDILHKIRDENGPLPSEVKTMIAYALTHVGDSYSMSSLRMDKDIYDCSSYAARSYQAAGINDFVPGGWAMCAAAEAEYLNNMGKLRTRADIDELRPGDLLFYTRGFAAGRFGNIGHVAIYLGEVDGVKMRAHASSSATGVKYASFTDDSTFVAFGHVID